MGYGYILFELLLKNKTSSFYIEKKNCGNVRIYFTCRSSNPN